MAARTRDTDLAIGRGDRVWYDGVDQDCDGASDNDADSDGYDSDLHGGTDCDDTDGSISPGAIEYAYDGIDQDSQMVSTTTTSTGTATSRTGTAAPIAMTPIRP